MKDPLVTRIEAQLGWGSGDTWSNKDFEALSERIFNDTNKRLSVTTLKRIWGRAELVANPSMATLDILSEFAGYDNWRAFVNTHKQEVAVQGSTKRMTPSKVALLIILLVALGACLAFFSKTVFTDTEGTTAYSPEDFKFVSRPVSEGIPNSVVFEYRAAAIRNGATLEIQQDWDRNKRQRIDKNDSIATSIYYHPGFFKSKLVVDDTIVKEDDVFITTKDWLGLIERDSVPIYLKKEEFDTDGLLNIDQETVASYNLDPSTSTVVVSFYQVRDFGPLSTDDFEFKATLKNEFDLGVNACQNVEVFILYDGGAIGIPLSKKGCSSGLSLMAFDTYVDGKKNDLSNFGVDFTDYVTLHCISRDNTLDIMVNDTLAYQMAVPNAALKIKGLSMHFEGAGSVKNVEFRTKEQVVYRSGS